MKLLTLTIVASSALFGSALCDLLIILGVICCGTTFSFEAQEKFFSLKKYKKSHKGHGHDDHKGYDKCHPQTITKYKTIYKERKANVVNQVEILKPHAHIKKITDVRYTTIRYPIFITQVIKPLLTQVETKIKPIFFTKTIKTYTKVVFTVTGIGQKTVTKIKYEKEYITRCKKKGYHRRSYDAEDRIAGKQDRHILPADHAGIRSHGASKMPVDEFIPMRISASGDEHIPKVLLSPPKIKNLDPSFANRPGPPYNIRINPRRPRLPPRSPNAPLFAKPAGKGGEKYSFVGRIGDVSDLYLEDYYYYSDPSRRGRELSVTMAHPPLTSVPVAVILV